MTDIADTSPTIQSGPSTSLDNLEEVSTNVPESAQGIFNNVLRCNVLVFIGPKKKDGDYQLYNIDVAGNIRGASTPFQFLEQPAKDHVQVQNDRIDINMIHKEKEMASTGTDGSQEAQQIDTKEDVQKTIDSLKQMFDDEEKFSTSLDVAENLPITESGEGNGGIQTLEVVSNSQGSQGALEQTSQGVHQAMSSQGSAKMEGALQRPASPDDNGLSEQTFSVKHAFKELKEEFDTLECNYQAAETENASLKRDFEKERERAQQEINQSRDDQALLVRKIRDLNDELKKTEQAAETENASLKRDFEKERARAQQEINQSKDDQALLVRKIRDLNDELKKTEQSGRERERAWQLRALCYEYWITELIHRYRSLKAYFRLKVYEDRTTGRPPRCIAITAKRRPCLRSAREFQHHNRLCLQHFKMRYGDPQ